MKGSVLTNKTWFLLIGAALLISAGILNFNQRARHQTPPWDGVTWVDSKDGVIEKLPGKLSIRLKAGDRIRIETPGGGGWGSSES